MKDHLPFYGFALGNAHDKFKGVDEGKCGGQCYDHIQKYIKIQWVQEDINNLGKV